MTTTRANFKLLYVTTFILGAIALIGMQLLQPSVVEAQVAPTTMKFELEKKFSGPVPQGYLANQFTFNVSGFASPVALTTFTVDSANGSIELPVGTYTLSENGPNGFVPSDWTVQWSGAGCTDVTGLSTTITVTQNDIELPRDANGFSNFGCRADNQWKPVNPNPVLGCTNPQAENYNPAATQDNGSCVFDNGNGDPRTGTLVVNKMVINDNGGTRATSSFSFTYSGATGNTSFDADGTNVLKNMATGTYTISESPLPIGYAVSYTNCQNVAILANATTTCTIINNDIPAGPQCVDETAGSWADTVVSSNQGNTKSVGPITNPDRIDPTDALGAEDWVTNGNTGFFSLGFGGSIILRFNSYVPNVAGADLTVYEATNGDTYPSETATVEVSQNGTTWMLAGTANNATIPGRTTDIDFNATGLDWITYVRITDTTNPAPHTNDADGFDLDAVKATQQVCSEPNDNGGGGNGDTYTIEGYKWNDTNGNGVKDVDESYIVGWEINAEKVGALNSNVTTLTNPNGFYSFTVSGGTWVVGEEQKEGWNQTFPSTNEGTCSLVFSIQTAKTATCNFGNQNINDDEDQPLYLVFGYVWHDENENDTWDLEQPNPADDENDLNAWTVQITNGNTTYSTTTDATGYYYFYVPAGTWTINEIVEEGWSKTFPNVNGHEVVVLEEITLGEETNFFAMVMDYLVPTAHAAVMPTTYGPYNFGNVFTNGGGGGGNGGGGGGGGGERIELTGRGGGNSDGNNTPSRPEGQVLGEATSAMPVGAPNTGAGGAMPVAPQLPILSAILSLSPSVRKVKNG